jgi:hypothetical protein
MAPNRKQKWNRDVDRTSDRSVSEPRLAPLAASCDCCGRTAKECELRSPLPGWQKNYHLPPQICSDCLYVWYDHGLTDPDEIKQRVLGGVRAP